jgi:hypothetical protein
MTTSEIIGVAAAVVVLAGISVAIIYGDRTAQVIRAGGNAFAQSIRAATLSGHARTK